MNRILFVSLAFAFTACGHPGTALDHNRAGSGNGTLQVTAEVDASNDSNNPMTSFQVDLADGIGNPVSGAVVTVHNGDFQDVALVEASAGSGHYVNSRAALSGADFGLDVSVGFGRDPRLRADARPRHRDVHDSGSEQPSEQQPDPQGAALQHGEHRGRDHRLPDERHQQGVHLVRGAVTGAALQNPGTSLAMISFMISEVPPPMVKRRASRKARATGVSTT